MTNYDKIASAMYTPFLSVFDQGILHYNIDMQRHGKSDQPSPEDMVKAATMAMHLLEKVFKDAGSIYKDTYDKTMQKLRNGQSI